MLAHVQSWLLYKYLAVRRGLVTGDAAGFKVSCTAVVLPACLCSLRLTFMQMGFKTLVSLVFLCCIVQTVEAQWVSGESAHTFFQDQWSYTGSIEWMRIMNSLVQNSCTVRSRWDSELAHDVSPDLHTVCSNRIASTHPITFVISLDSLPFIILSHHSPLSAFCQYTAISAKL